MILFIVSVLVSFGISFFFVIHVIQMKKRGMPISVRWKQVLAAALVIPSLLFLYERYFFTFGSLKGTHYRGPVASPDGTYTADAYFKEYGGAAGGVSIWVTVTKEASQTERVVYYGEAHELFNMKWTDDQSLSVTNDPYSVVLHVQRDLYHHTRRACDSVLLAGTYETCRQS